MYILRIYGMVVIIYVQYVWLVDRNDFILIFTICIAFDKTGAIMPDLYAILFVLFNKQFSANIQI